jgi:hypothetical protein
MDDESEQTRNEKIEILAVSQGGDLLVREDSYRGLCVLLAERTKYTVSDFCPWRLLRPKNPISFSAWTMKLSVCRCAVSF